MAKDVSAARLFLFVLQLELSRNKVAVGEPAAGLTPLVKCTAKPVATLPAMGSKNLHLFYVTFYLERAV